MRYLKYFGLLLLALVAILFFNTFRYSSKQLSITAEKVAAVSDSALSHFQQAIQYQTVSFGYDIKPDSVQFVGFRNFLEKTYPLVHQKMSREIVGGYTLVYQWKGKNTDLKPAIIMAHQDVVPIEPATKNLWEVEPFGGVIKDGYIWGRGTTDDKINVIAELEAAENLLKNGFTPDRTLYFVFGHDEEVAGQRGALQVAKLMEERGIKAEFVLDEGGMIAKNKMPGIEKPMALIATAEKGYLSIEMEVNIAGGHSSFPSKETALDVLSKAIVAIREKQMPYTVSESVQNFFDHIGPELPFFTKLVFANQWLFKPLIVKQMATSDPKIEAMLHTTTVPTIVQSGIKDNVIPTIAKATVNFRILPGDDSKKVLEHVKNVINDERVKVTPIGTIMEPSKISNVTGFGFQKIAKHTKTSFDDAMVTPFLLIGATDSRHFINVTDQIIKFSPMIDPIGFHAVNERVSVESYQRAIHFYQSLFRDLK